MCNNTPGTRNSLCNSTVTGKKRQKKALHIVPFGKFHKIGGAPPDTFPNVRYDAPEEMGGERKCFDSPIRKGGLAQIIYVISSRSLTLCSLTVFCCP